MDCDYCSARFDLNIHTPKILPNCGHSLCRLCIEELWQDGIVCPRCKTKTQADSPNALPINESIIELAKASYLCNLHERPVEAYCLTESRFLCVKCILEDHRNHSVMSLEKAAETELEKFSTIKVAAFNLQDELVENERYLVGCMETLSQEFEKTADGIKDLYNSLKNILIERESDIFSELSEILRSNMQIYKSRVEENRNHISNIKILQEEISVIQGKSPIEILRSKKQRDTLFNQVSTHIKKVKISHPFTKFTVETESRMILEMIKECLPAPVVKSVSKSEPIISSKQNSYPFNPATKLLKPKTFKIRGKSRPTSQVRRPSIESFCHEFDLESLISTPLEQIYTFGGFSERSEITTEVYDVSSENSSSLGKPPKIRTEFSAVFYNDNIYLLGGKISGQRTDSIETYSKENNTYTLSNIELPSPLSGFGCVVSNNSLIVAGGNESVPLDTVLRYDGRIWSSLPAMKSCREEFSLLKAPDKSIYAIGGFGEKCLNSAERLDLRSKKWEELPHMKKARRALSAVMLPDGIYSIGGFDGSRYLNSVEKFDIRMNQWQTISNLNKARCTFSAVASQDCQWIFALGGFDEHGIDLVERYSVVNNEWTEAGNLLTTRFMHSSLNFIEKI